MPPRLEKTRANGIEFSYAMSDAGYDARENYVGVGEVFGAVPVIPLNLRNLLKTKK